MIIDPEILYLPEPKLTFGFNQKAIDPRDGLLLYGPFDSKRILGPITIGIIGPKYLREQSKIYLKKLHAPIANEDFARPNFPGLESAFGISINFESIVEIDIKEDDLETYKKYVDSHQRIHNWTNLYVDRLRQFVIEEDRNVPIWFVAIPEYIYQYGRPQSRIPKDSSNILTTLKKKDRNTSQLSLFFQEEEDLLREAYKFEVNFHNQLKAKVLDDRIVTQIIRESKITLPNLEDSNIIKLESAKAWNLSTTLYYKLGGLPWKLGDVRNNVCYLGLVYKKTEESNQSKNACCAAQMFLDSGDGMVFRGNVGPWWNPKTKEFHLSKQDALSMVSQSLDAFYTRFNYYPEEIFIHARTYFNDDEWDGFTEATLGKSRIIGVRIREVNNFKLYRDRPYCVPRGLMLKYDTHRAYLWTKGFIPRFKSQIGLEVPSPLDISITRGDGDILVVCKDILGLSKLNYNTCIYGDGVPVTLKFADSIGEILTATRDLHCGILPFKHYI